MLDADVQMNVWPRTAGTGSLGRPRWVALAEWKGGPVVREAKAAVPSAWGRNANKIAIMEIARGRYRAPDPWYQLTEENVIVRRLSFWRSVTFTSRTLVHGGTWTDAWSGASMTSTKQLKCPS